MLLCQVLRLESVLRPGRPRAERDAGSCEKESCNSIAAYSVEIPLVFLLRDYSGLLK